MASSIAEGKQVCLSCEKGKEKKEVDPVIEACLEDIS
jgi:hypothetical protein